MSGFKVASSVPTKEGASMLPRKNREFILPGTSSVSRKEDVPSMLRNERASYSEKRKGATSEMSKKEGALNVPRKNGECVSIKDRINNVLRKEGTSSMLRKKEVPKREVTSSVSRKDRESASRKEGVSNVPKKKETSNMLRKEVPSMSSKEASFNELSKECASSGAYRKEKVSNVPNKDREFSMPRREEVSKDGTSFIEPKEGAFSGASSMLRKEGASVPRKEGVTRKESAFRNEGKPSVPRKEDSSKNILPETTSKSENDKKSSNSFDEKVCKQLVLGSIYESISSSPEMVQYNKFLSSRFKAVSSYGVVPTSDMPNQVFLCLQPDRIIAFKIVVGMLSSENPDAIVITTGLATGGNHDIYPHSVNPPSLIKESSDGAKKMCCKSVKNMQIGETACLSPRNLSYSYVIQVVLPLAEQRSQDDSCCNKALRNCLSDAVKMHLRSIAFPGIKPRMINHLIGFLCETDSANLHTVSIVLKTDSDAEEYKRALSSLILESESKDVTSCVQSNLQASRSSIIWSWRENDGFFVPYTPRITDLLTEEYERGSDCAFFSVGDVMYSVDFARMKQMNLETSGEREVLHITSNGNCSMMWEYLNENGIFTPYSVTDVAVIENLFQKKDESTPLTILKRAYRFDFTAMKQINVITGFERSIRRRLSESPRMARKPVFLRNGEVVVNIMSSSLENLDSAKTALEKKLKGLLFTKTIPYPAPSKVSLLSKIQAVAKKHKISCEVGTQSESKACPSKQVLKLQGLQASVEKALLKIQEKILASLCRSGEVECPREWEVMSEYEQIKYVELSPLDKEYDQVYKKFHQTMNILDFSITQLHRVQNKHLWTRYQQSKARLQDKQSQVNEKELFHGTRTNPAKTICSSEEGFDMRYSREGMWGCANYFAVKASYSDNYSYYDQNTGTCEMILAKVLTGDSFSCESDPSLRMPPLKNHGQAGVGKLQQVRYDSVNGVTHGCRVFMTYSNDLAYPAFIITYRCENVTMVPPSSLSVQPSVKLPVQSLVKKTAPPVKNTVKSSPSVQAATPSSMNPVMALVSSTPTPQVNLASLSPPVQPPVSKQTSAPVVKVGPSAPVLLPSPLLANSIQPGKTTASKVQLASVQLVTPVPSQSQPSVKPTSSWQTTQPQSQPIVQPVTPVPSPSKQSAKPTPSQQVTQQQAQPTVQPVTPVPSPSQLSVKPTLSQQTAQPQAQPSVQPVIPVPSPSKPPAKPTMSQQIQAQPSMQPVTPVPSLAQPLAKLTPPWQIAQPQTQSSMQTPVLSPAQPQTKPTPLRQIAQPQIQPYVQPMTPVPSPLKPSAKPTPSRQIAQPQAQLSMQPVTPVPSPSQPLAKHTPSPSSMQPVTPVLSPSKPSANLTTHFSMKPVTSASQPLTRPSLSGQIADWPVTSTQAAKRKFSPDKDQPPSPPAKRAQTYTEKCTIA